MLEAGCWFGAGFFVVVAGCVAGADVAADAFGVLVAGVVVGVSCDAGTAAICVFGAIVATCGESVKEEIETKRAMASAAPPNMRNRIRKRGAMVIKIYAAIGEVQNSRNGKNLLGFRAKAGLV